MKTKILFSIFLLSSSLILLMSCGDDNEDLTKPEISLNSPEEGAVFLIGDEDGVCFDADLEDDVMLSSYKLNIHSNFDGHGHARLDNASTVDFRLEQTYDISGKKNAHVHHHDIVIPANATPGKYHFMIFCTDASGNEIFIARNIVLSHDAQSGQH